MKGPLTAAAFEGFVGSFVLAGALVAAMTSGAWRVVSRLYSAFAQHKPLQVSPGRELKIP